MIVLIGESASGKSYLEKELVDRGFNKIISYTTRPMRQGEINGVDYHFIDKDDFLKLKEEGFFCESTTYRDWLYGAAKKDCTDDKVIVVEPCGFRQLSRVLDLNVKSLYIKVDERERAIRMIRRGDNLMEVFRRIFSDQGVFQNIENEVDYVINNNEFQGLEEILKLIEV